MRKLLFIFFTTAQLTFAQQIPLPEHPRPDFERTEWLNLNGQWAFEFDSLNKGLTQNWADGNTKFSKNINVPFPWGSKLSGVKDEADIAWYQKEITVPAAWTGKKVFFTIGASDWETTVWFDGKLLGKHQGGYTPFDFDLTPFVKAREKQKIVVRVDDIRRDFTLYGKQGYGNARGIWQTAYLEARGNSFFENIHFTPDIDNGSVKIDVLLGEKTKADQAVSFKIYGPKGVIEATGLIAKGREKATIYVKIPEARLWTLEDPYLYEVEAYTGGDVVKSYFGMRKISVTPLPGTNIPYVALNNKPVYLQLTLDQSYHPEGFYTFPSDEFMKNEILLAKNIGLNGIRTHIKVDIPRKLYWADKLGLFVMSDLPNFWGEPDENAQKESEFTLREMIKRDYNHPAIFSWIIFNETWGLRSTVTNPETGKEESKYTPATQKWVTSMYYLAKSLDPTRLAEDNSICCGAGHTVTDINSWHEYLPGYGWEKHMQSIDNGTFPGSTFHYEKGYAEAPNTPMINSECGNVWGYKGSTGDVDWSYDYHRMMNAFRIHPKMAGWLYTEHHDVINEWNGYWRFDRSKKFTGLPEILPGMTDKDFHSEIYLSTGQDITFTAKAGSDVMVPLFLSVMTDRLIADNKLALVTQLTGTDKLGRAMATEKITSTLPYRTWMQEKLSPLSVHMPDVDGVYTLALVLQDASGRVHHRNFVNFVVTDGKIPDTYKIYDIAPNSYKKSEFSLKKWEVMSGKKVNGAGKGYIEYEFNTKKLLKAPTGYLMFELGAKELFFKDREGSEIKNTDYMLGAKAEPSQNQNSYPMTDEKAFPSAIKILIDNKLAKKVTLDDDPADHRGILSWHNQKEDGTLSEAGSYGYLVKVPLTGAQLASLKVKGKMKVRIETEGLGGLAVYGKDFGRYGINPSLVIQE